jgi:hypothetical protein
MFAKRATAALRNVGACAAGCAERGLERVGFMGVMSWI